MNPPFKTSGIHYPTIDDNATIIAGVSTLLADRFNKSKPKWSLVDYDSLIPLVDVLQFGAYKYGTNNWKKGLSYTETTESLLRHVYAFLNNQDIDEESKLHHIGHILCNAMFLSYMIKNRPDLDDRRSEDNSAQIKGESA